MTAVDASAETIAEASTRPDSSVAYLCGDILDPAVQLGRYDVISCLASIHHVPFEPAIRRLRSHLVPGGVLVILGCYREQTTSDRLLSLLAVPANVIVGAGHRAVRTANHRSTLGHRAPVSAPAMPWRDIKAQAGRLLPGARIRRHLFWRYSLTFRQPVSGNR